MPFPFLNGIRMLDLSQYLPGPYASLILADLGADVVRIEPPGGEPMRRVGPRDGDGVSSWYKAVNRGKTVIELDLKSSDGKQAFENLVAGADALLESYRPGVMDRLGFGHERLHEINPAIVSCSLSGWGLTGPYRLRGGHDINYMALMGGLERSGTAERPMLAYPPTADFSSGMHAALTIMGALIGRGRTGKGATLDVSIAETVLPWQIWALNGMLREGWEVPRAGQFPNGGAAFYGIYKTKDGRFVTLGALEEKFWCNFCEAVGHPEWGPRQWEDRPQTDLIETVTVFIADHTLDEMNALLEGVDCCYEPVHELADVPDHPHVEARAMMRRHGGDDPFFEVLFPAWVDGAPPPDRDDIKQTDAADVLAAWAAQSG